MTALKSLSNNSSNSGILVLTSIDCIFHSVEIFLILCMMSDFQVKSGHFWYCA